MAQGIEFRILVGSVKGIKALNQRAQVAVSSLKKKVLNPKLAREMDGRGEAMRSSHPEPSTGTERIIQENAAWVALEEGGRNQEERQKRRKG